LVPVPQAERVVAEWRSRHDPVAAAGVPAHVTLLAPWLPADEIGPQPLAELAGAAASTRPWEFRLTGAAWFGRRVLWLVPDPAEPFARLTSRLAEQFGTPPWGGAFDEVVPHLTVGQADGDPTALDRVADELQARLPLACRADELWVMLATGRRWSVRARLPFGRSPGGPAGSAAMPRRHPGRPSAP
jgi:2'-5' RNA ligase